MEWYRWFPLLYAEDTLTFTLEQDAIYRRLLDHYMTTRMPLPSHAIALARICQISLEEFEKHSTEVMSKFTLKNGKFHQKRCDIELNRQDAVSKKLSDAAKKAHEIRQQNQNDASLGTAKAYAKAAIEEKRGEVDNKERKEERDAKPKRVKSKKPVTFISEEFRGDIKSISLAGSLNLDFEREQRKFIDHYLAKGEARADWQASFRTWLNRAAEYGAERAARSASGRQEVRDVTGAALRVIAARNKTYN